MSFDRVLVTGGTGAVGSWVTRGFAERGIVPVVFVRGSSDDLGRAINGDIDDRLIWAHGDLLEPLTLVKAVQEHRPQVIVHMATAKPWQIEPPFVPEPKTHEGLDQIVGATVNVLEVARILGVRRVVFASTKGVYGDITGPYGPPEYRPLPTDYPKQPVMIYGIAKLSAEMLGGYYADHFGLEFTAIRFASSYGPLKRGPTTTSPDGIARAAADGLPVTIHRFGPGEKDDFVYNKDVAQGFVLAALAERLPSRAYNIGSGIGSDQDDIVRAVAEVFPSARVEMVDAPIPGPAASITLRARCVMDIEPARRELGYEPHYANLADAFRDIVAEDARIGAGAPA